MSQRFCIFLLPCSNPLPIGLTSWSSQSLALLLCAQAVHLILLHVLFNKERASSFDLRLHHEACAYLLRAPTVCPTVILLHIAGM